MQTVHHIRMRAQPAAAPAAGDLWYDADRLAHRSAGGGGLVGTLGRAIFVQTADGGVTGAAEASVFAAGMGTRTIPAGTLQAGTAVQIAVGGLISTAAASAGTLTLAVRLGGVGGTLLASTGPLTLGLGLSKQRWDAAITIVCRAAGAAGACVAVGSLVLYPAALGTPAVAGLAPAAAAAVATTADQLVEVTAAFSLASTSNVLGTTVAAVEVVG